MGCTATRPARPFLPRSCGHPKIPARCPPPPSCPGPCCRRHRSQRPPITSVPKPLRSPARRTEPHRHRTWHRTVPVHAVPDPTLAASAPGARTQHPKSCPVMSQHPVLSTRTLRWGTQHLVCGSKAPNPVPEPRTPPVAGPDPISPALACGSARSGSARRGAALAELPSAGRCARPRRGPCRAARTTAPPAGRPARRAPPRVCEGHGPAVLRGPDRGAAGVPSKSRSTPA